MKIPTTLPTKNVLSFFNPHKLLISLQDKLTSRKFSVSSVLTVDVLTFSRMEIGAGCIPSISNKFALQSAKDVEGVIGVGSNWTDRQGYYFVLISKICAYFQGQCRRKRECAYF